MLTAKQHELLLFIHRRLAETGVSPSFEEMKEALDLRSKSGVHRLISALEERAFIRRLPNRARALEVLRMPETAVPAAKPAADTMVRGDFRRVAAMSASWRLSDTRGWQASMRAIKWSGISSMRGPKSINGVTFSRLSSHRTSNSPHGAAN